MSYWATNLRNIDQLRDNRDRAGILQLADVLTKATHPDAPALAQHARDAIDWIDATAPDTVNADAAVGLRVGDILTYLHAGHLLQGVVLTITGDTATTNLGHEVTIER